MSPARRRCGRKSSAVPEVPAVPGAVALASAVARALAPDGPLARALPGFEARPGQVEMADAVAGVIAEGGVLLAEAGTGTGKTLAYLVPAILSRQRVLVSTGTKNLQEQIFFKDLPVLRDTLGVPFTRDVHEGARQLPLPAPVRRVQGQPGNPFARGGHPPARDRRVAPRDRDGRPRRDRGPARRSAVLERGRRQRRELHRRRLPAVRRLLRHADAPARGRVGHRHRQSPPAVRGRGRAAERVRRSDPGHATTRSSTRRTSSRTSRRSTSASPSATTASTMSRATWTARSARRSCPTTTGRPGCARRRARARSRAGLLRGAADDAVRRRPRREPGCA
jgi:hypothetical protein